jgi:hypothetical protein
MLLLQAMPTLLLWLATYYRDISWSYRRVHLYPRLARPSFSREPRVSLQSLLLALTVQYRITLTTLSSYLVRIALEYLSKNGGL